MHIYNLFIHLSLNRHLGCFHLLATMGNLTTDMCIKVLTRVPVLNYLGYMSRSRLAESFGNFFNFFNSSPNFSSALSTFSVGFF